MRPTTTRTLAIAGAAALILAACTGSCGRTHLQTTEGARAAGSATTLDYAPFMKTDGEALVAAFAAHLGVALSPSFDQDGGRDRDGDPQRVPNPSRDAPQPAKPAGSARDHDGDPQRVPNPSRDAPQLAKPAGSARDHDIYAVAHGGIIRVDFDRQRRPLTLHYRAPIGCPSRRQAGGTPLTPAQANAQVLSMLRRMGHDLDDTVAVESQLHQDAWSWLGVNVRQTYRGELVELPKVFVMVDGITGQICEMQLGRWHAGLNALGPPLPADELLARARIAGASSGRRPGPPTLRTLRIVDDTLCRVVRFADAPELALCLDVVTGEQTAGP